MYKIIFIFIAVFGLASCNVYQKTHQTFSIQLRNGEVKSRGQVSTKKSTKTDQFSYYQRWDNELIDYHDNGEVKSIAISHYKIGTYGRPCKELLNEYTEYNDSGVKIYESRDVCDCKKSTEIKYNNDGKVISKKVLKVKRLK
jgi:hypothetical protein